MPFSRLSCASATWASTALYLALALLAARIERTWLRVLTTVVCLALPLLVTYARLYRGMHHVSDVAVGMLNGIACALLAWGWWRWTRSRHAGSATDRTRAAVS